MTRRWLKIVAGSGAVIFLFGVIAELLRSNAELRHINLGSRPDWVNPPYTSFETFILGVSIGPFLITGGALLLIALVWALWRKCAPWIK